MMDLATIQQQSREAALTAARERRLPFLVEYHDLHAIRSRLRGGAGSAVPFPDIGSYRPPGFRTIRTLFIDTSGFGSPRERALTFEQLANEITIGHAYAFIEIGQFQAYLREYRPIKKGARV